MPTSGVSLSSTDLYRAWRYAVDTDFQDLSDNPKPIETVELPYASNDRHLPFQRPPTSLDYQHAISKDERWLALGVGAEIDLYDLTTDEKTTICGHTVEIRCLAFNPSDSGMLISSASAWDYTGDTQTCEVFIWDLQEVIETGATRIQPDRIKEWTDDLINGVRAKLSKSTPPLPLEQPIEDDLARTLSTLFGRIGNRSSPRKIHGRLCQSFQSSMFSHNGKTLIILPGASPSSNGDNAWDMALYDLETDESITLKGHRDSIMWTSFTPDDKLMISAAWDGTFRVWRPQTGECLRVWETNQQNWTGAISPDSKQFLGTDGEGTIWVRDLETGELRWSYGESQGWRRQADWSSDGKFVIVAGDSLGQITLFDTREPIVDGVLKPIQTRKLSMDKTNLEPEVRDMARGFLSVASLRFIPSASGEIRFGSSTYIDLAVEVVSITQGKRWRFVPAVGPRDEDETTEGMAGRRLGPLLAPNWTILEGEGQIAIVSRSGVWFWKLG